MLAYGAAQIDFQINYFDLGSQTSGVIQPFYVSQDNQRIQIDVFSYSLDNQHIGLVHYNNQILKVVVEFSSSKDFAQHKVIFSEVSDTVNYGLYGQSGWYRIVITNLSNIKVGVGYSQVQSTLGNYIFTAISAVLFALGIALLSILFSLALTFSIMLVIFYPLFKLIELSSSKRERERIYITN